MDEDGHRKKRKLGSHTDKGIEAVRDNLAMVENFY